MHDWSDYGNKLAWSFNEFVDHPINKKLSEPGVSECRFWTKKAVKGYIQEPSDGPDDKLWKPDVGEDENWEVQKCSQ